MTVLICSLPGCPSHGIPFAFFMPFDMLVTYKNIGKFVTKVATLFEILFVGK